MNPAVMARLNATPAAAPILAALKRALAGSLHDVFLAGTFVVLVAFVVTFMLVDLPLRTTNRTTASNEDGALEPVPQFEL